MLIIVMVCLLLVSMIGASMLKLTFALRQQIQREQLRLQATWLAEAGVERAAALLMTNQNYVAEDWRLKADDAINGKPALVKIRVEADAKIVNRRVVFVVADFPSDSDQRARVSKRVVIDL